MLRREGTEPLKIGSAADRKNFRCAAVELVEPAWCGEYPVTARRRAGVPESVA